MISVLSIDRFSGKALTTESLAVLAHLTDEAVPNAIGPNKFDATVYRETRKSCALVAPTKLPDRAGSIEVNFSDTHGIAHDREYNTFMATHPDVLIVGGGVIGLTTAYYLSRAGKSVEVLDRGELGAEASWAGAGIIPPGNPDHAPTAYDRLRGESSRMFPAFTAELRELTGIDNGYRPCGGVEFLDEHDDESLPAWQNEQIEYFALTPQELAKSEANLSFEPRAYLLPAMAQVRNPWHTRMLIAACRRVGIKLMPGIEVKSIETSGSSTVAGIRLSSGERLTAGQYLIASGAWSEQLLSPLGVATGIHPVRGQIVLLKTASTLLRRIVMKGKNYLVPREDGHILIGATEEPEAGFEKRTTARAVADLIALATAMVSGLAAAEVVKCWAGLRPGSLDHLPSLGPVTPYENLYLASGHFRAGIQLSPATGMIMSELLCGREPRIPLQDFVPGREPSRPFWTAFRS
jgi:glycine oxidase